jgi:hypothetical protein
MLATIRKNIAFLLVEKEIKFVLKNAEKLGIKTKDSVVKDVITLIFK